MVGLRSAVRGELLVQLFCSMSATFLSCLSTGAFRNAFSLIETAVKLKLFSVWLGLEQLVLACFTSGVCHLTAACPLHFSQYLALGIIPLGFSTSVPVRTLEGDIGSTLLLQGRLLFPFPSMDADFRKEGC